MHPPKVLESDDPIGKRRRRGAGLGSPLLNILVVGLGATVLAWPYFLPKPADTYALAKTLEAPTDRELIIMSADGKPFARRGGCYGTPVSVDEIPDHFIKALLAMEDRRFYQHIGLDPVGILRAALFNYNAGRIVQGGSTITQQLAKITYLTSARTYERKLEEVLAVLRLELSLTKNEILERYLSRAYFGESCFGLRGAARHYFGREVKDLTVAQSAHLVALLKSPTALASNEKDLQAREQLVLAAMQEQGWLDEKTRAEIKPAKKIEAQNSPFGAYYADWVAETIKLPENGDTRALPVRTAFDPKVQKAAEESVAHILERFGKNRKASQAALVAMRPDGRVVAMVGGLNHTRSQFNRATQALRQPGSSFKAFVYLAAMRAGGNPQMVVSDEPLTIGEWSPENYNRSYRGPISLQRAFSSSINTVAVRLSETVGREEVIAAARDLGITTKLNADPSIALGTSEVTLLELTSAYAAFSAGAYPVKPWGIVAMGENTKKTGRPPQGAGVWRLMQRDTMRQMMSATVQFGTGRGARLPIPAYGKTGTSQNYRDAWFIGYAGNLVVGVWVGNDDNSPMRRVTGGNLPALIWRDFMNKARTQDKNFSPSIRSANVFPSARNPRPRAIAHSGVLDSLLIGGGYRFAQYEQGYPYRGRAMLFGQPAGYGGYGYGRPSPYYNYQQGGQPRYQQYEQQQYRQQPAYRPSRSSRPVQGWVHNRDGS